MVITITMRNVIKQGNTYHFRISVPEDCREAVGQWEIVKTLETKDPVEAAHKAKALTAECKQRFKDIRSGGKTEPPEAVLTTS